MRLENLRTIQIKGGAALVRSRIYLAGGQRKSTKRAKYVRKYPLCSKPSALPGRCALLRAQFANLQVLTSGASYVNCLQIMGELNLQAVEATSSRGKA
jgi:hypothetical protein